MRTGMVQKGLPVGGTAGQILRKRTSTTYDTEWAAPAAVAIPAYTNYAAITAIASPQEGQQAVAQDTDITWTYTMLAQGGTWLPPPGTMVAQVVRGLVQSILTGTNTAVIWENVAFEIIAGQFWGSGSPTRLTIPWRGLYRIDLLASFAAHATGWRKACFSYGGLANIMLDSVTQFAPGNATVAPSWVVTWNTRLFPGDYVEACVVHSAGVSLNFNSNTYAVMTATWLGP